MYDDECGTTYETIHDAGLYNWIVSIKLIDDADEFDASAPEFVPC